MFYCVISPGGCICVNLWKDFFLLFYMDNYNITRISICNTYQWCTVCSLAGKVGICCSPWHSPLALIIASPVSVCLTVPPSTFPGNCRDRNCAGTKWHVIKVYRYFQPRKGRGSWYHQQSCHLWANKTFVIAGLPSYGAAGINSISGIKFDNDILLEGWT